MRSEFEKLLKQHRDALTDELVKLGKHRQVQLVEWDIEQNKSDYEFYFDGGNQIIERLKAENVVLQAKVDELQVENKILNQAASTHLKNQMHFKKLYDALVEQLYPYVLDLGEPVDGDVNTPKEYVDGYNRARECVHYNLLEMLKSNEEYIRAQCGMLGGGGEASAVWRFTDYDLLIIDEYGLHDQHESRLQLVHKVLYSRYDAKKPTVLISNWTKEQLKENLGDRLWSRFQHDGLTVVECNWADARAGEG